MSDHGQSNPQPPEGGNVPRLVDTYRSHREALHSRVQELVNLREQIRSAAAREATEIVDTARKDVRQILVKARRELLVLSAQVQAATDERPRALEGDAPTSSQRDRVLAEAARVGLALEGEGLVPAKDALLNARQGVQQILEGARPDLEALDAEVRLLRAGAGQPVDDRRPAQAIDEFAPDVPGFRPDPEPPAAWDLSLSTPPAPNRFALLPRVAVFVAAFGVLGIIAMIGTTWWRGSSAAERPQPGADDVRASGRIAGETAEVIAPVPGPVAEAAPVSVRLEAVRDVWLRTTIDGQADAGRLLRAGETRNVSAAGDIAIRIGDGGALLVSTNGGRPTPAGPNGQVVTRVFSQETSAPAPLVSTPAEDPPPALVARNSAPPAPAPAPALEDAPPIVTIDPPVLARPAPAPPPPAAPPAVSAAPPAAAPPTAGGRGTEAAEGELVPAAQRWFTQYHQGLLAASGDGPNVTDDRSAAERPQSGVMAQRQFDDVRVQLVGDNALYTARMTERVQAGNAASQYVSLVSQVWMRRSGAWRLVDVRLVSAGRLGTP